MSKGHGWVTPIGDGSVVARCGGPAICKKCQREKMELERSNRQSVKLICVAVEDPPEIEYVRQIRNATAAGFSTYNDVITPDDHRAWWERTKPLAWLYASAEGIVGFGLLRKDDQDRWVTVVAVLPEHDGRGYGKYITADIVRRSPGIVYATARLDNLGAVFVHVPEDWERIDGEDPKLAYFRGWPRPEWPPEGAEEQWAESGWAGEGQ